MKQFFDFSLQLEYFLQLQAGFQLGKTRILSQPWKCLKADGNSGYQIRKQNCSVWDFSFLFFFSNGDNWSVVCSGFGVRIVVSEGLLVLLEMKEDCVLVVHGGTVVLLEFPSKTPQHSTDSGFGRAPLVVAHGALWSCRSLCASSYCRVGLWRCPWDWKEWLEAIEVFVMWSPQW